MRKWLPSWLTPWLAVLLIVVGGCVVVGLKHMMPIEKERAQIQKQRGNDIAQTAGSIIKALPEGTSTEVVDELNYIRSMGEEAQKDAVMSERWSTAGEKVLGPPPTVILADTDAENVILAQTEREAETLGKVRGIVGAGKKILAAGGGGGLGGWMTGGGLLATLTVALGLAEKGRRVLKSQDGKRKQERDEDRQEQLDCQKERDLEQDQKLDALMTVLNTRMDAIEKKTKDPA